MSSFKGKVKNYTEGDFPVAPPGNHPAVLVALVDLGTQKREYGGNVTWDHMIYLVWELTGEKMPDKADNFVIGLSCKLSFGSKATLRGIIEKWRGKALNEGEEFDPEILVGKTCLVTVTENETGEGKKYAKVEGVAGVPKGMKVPGPQRKPFIFEIGGREPALPEWLPYLFGRKVSEWITDGRAGNKRQEENSNGADSAHEEPAEEPSSSDEVPF